MAIKSKSVLNFNMDLGFFCYADSGVCYRMGKDEKMEIVIMRVRRQNIGGG